MTQIALALPCPCGRERPAWQCCFSAGVFQPRSAVARRKPPLLHYSHPKCYARHLNDCSGKLSLEHYVSRGVLSQLGSKLRVAGLAGASASEVIGIDRFGSKVLCQRHNTALSGLDGVAEHLFRFIRAARTEPFDTGTQVIRSFCGADVERWLLKCLMGMGASKQIRDRFGKPLVWWPNPSWLHVLFGHREMPPMWGLFVHGRLGLIQHDPGHIRVMPMTDVTGEVNGIQVELEGFSFMLALSDVSLTGVITQEDVHRPGEIRFQAGDANRSMFFGWDERPCPRCMMRHTTRLTLACATRCAA